MLHIIYEQCRMTYMHNKPAVQGRDQMNTEKIDPFPKFFWNGQVSLYFTYSVQLQLIEEIVLLHVKKCVTSYRYCESCCYIKKIVYFIIIHDFIFSCLTEASTMCQFTSRFVNPVNARLMTNTLPSFRMKLSRNILELIIVKLNPDQSSVKLHMILTWAYL